jgi:hypothetical protein
MKGSLSFMAIHVADLAILWYSLKLQFPKICMHIFICSYTPLFSSTCLLLMELISTCIHITNNNTNASRKMMNCNRLSCSASKCADDAQTYPPQFTAEIVIYSLNAHLTGNSHNKKKKYM